MDVLKHALTWEVDAVSKRTLKIKEVDPLQPISGHNGEWLGVLAGAWGAFLRLGDEKTSMEIQQMIQCELDREAQAFKYLRQLKPSVEVNTAMLKLAAILTHNVGDVDQGLGYWAGKNDIHVKHPFRIPSNSLYPTFVQRMRFQHNEHCLVVLRMSERNGLEGSTPKRRRFTKS